MIGTSTPIIASRSAMRGTAAAAAGVLTVMRTSSEPARASSAICFAVLAGSSVSVLVIDRSEEHTSELQSLMRISYAVFCLKKKKTAQNHKKVLTDTI